MNTSNRREESAPTHVSRIGTILIILTSLVVIGFVVWLITAQPFELPEDEDLPRDDVTTWQTYTNDDFGFTLRHPPTWNVAVSAIGADDIAPKINIYKGEVPASALPFTHFSDVTNVSVFPYGIPTEGVSGDRADSDIHFSEEVTDTYTYVLEDGSPWATIAYFQDLPGSWEEYGFLWARVKVNELDITCMRNGEEVSEIECDPLMGDTVTRSGEINHTDWATVERILESFRFTDGSTGADNDGGLTDQQPGENTSRELDGCVITGCSAHICAEEETVSTCEYNEVYACYETAICERDENNECGWRSTEELRQCISNSEFDLRF